MLDKDSHDLYLQSLEEFVLDENRVVTYKWISKTLGIHVNLAKQLLHEFSTKSDEAKAAGIKKTYLLSGILQNGRGCNVTVVSEDDVREIKSHYKIITSEHVYSVQKKKNTTPVRDLYKIDRFQKDEGNPISAIICSKCLPRTDTEVAELRLIAEASTVTSDVKQWPKTAASKENSSSNHVSEVETSKKTEEHNNAPIKREAKSGTIAAMFNAQSSRPQMYVENAKTTVKQKAKGGGIATFFNKNAEVKSTKSPKTENTAVSEKPHTQESCRNSPRKENGYAEKKRKSECVVHESSPSKKLKLSEPKNEVVETKKSRKGADVKLNNAKKSNKKKGKNNGEHENLAKKRKRIIVADSDSDDDIFEKEQLPESPPPPFEEPEPVLTSQQSELEDIIPCTPQQELNKGRKRVQKMVDKTFMDDEGYMITKKEFVYESCSESETDEGKENNTKETNESESKKSAKNEVEKKLKLSPKKNASPPQKSKQSTLMSFFKKS